MSEPRFQVGDFVAVLTIGCAVVIPVTFVTSRQWNDDGVYKNSSTGNLKKLYPAWVYGVAGRADEQFAEWCLRPIDPDTEYTEQEQELTA